MNFLGMIEDMGIKLKKDIFKYVSDGDVEKVKQSLNDMNSFKIDINFKNENGYTLLMIACRTNNYKIVEILLNKGADPNIKTKFSGWFALMYAAEYSDTDIINLLLEKGADINLKNDKGWNALCHSIYRSKIANAIFLTEKGSDVNMRNDEGWTPLMFSVRNNKDPDILKFLLSIKENAVDINAAENKGKTALMFAAGESHHDSSLENVKVLLEQGADINILDNDGNTALYHAVRLSDKTSSLETVKFLLDHGADPFIGTICPTKECKNVLNEHRWKRLYQRDKDTARRYSKNFIFEEGKHIPKEIWEIILLHKRNYQLCQNLNNDTNKDILIFFALEFGIPVTEDMSKSKIFRLISRYLSYGKSEKNLQVIEKQVEKEDEILRMKIKEVAFKVGLDPSEDIRSLLKKLSKLF